MTSFIKLIRLVPGVLLLTLPTISHAAFKGTLNPGVQVTVEVTSSSGNAGRTAVTIMKVVKQDRFDSVDAVSAPPNGAVTANVSLSSSVQRLIVSVNPPVGGNAMLRVSQGAGNMFEDQVQGDMVFVYDVEAPGSTGFSVRLPPENQ